MSQTSAPILALIIACTSIRAVIAEDVAAAAYPAYCTAAGTY